MNNSTALSQFAVNLKYEDIPVEVAETAKKMAIQTIGAALAGKEMDFTQSVLDFSKKYSTGPSNATLMLNGEKTSLLGAVFANSIIADNIDWEDCSWTGHPSAGLVPAALALAEARGKSGRDFLTAIVAGFEVYQRIAMVIQPPRGFKSNIGWGLTSWQIFASCAPAAKLMDLSTEQYEQALGIAAVLMPVPNSLVHYTMSNVYHYQHGFCAQDGVLSAMLAKHGVDGMKTLLKHWPTNMWVQASLDIMDAFMREDGVTAAGIEEIIVDPPTERRMTLRPEGYDKIIEAQYSIPYCIAALLLDPMPGPQWYTAERMHDPELLALAAKVKPGPSAEQDLQESFNTFQDGGFVNKTITVKCTDGRVLTRSLNYPKGHPKNQLSLEEVCERFRVQARDALSPERMEAALHTLMNIENQDDMSMIGEILH